MAHQVRIRVALAALTVLATALAGCAGQRGEQQVVNEAAGNEPAVTAPDGYTESVPATEEADPTKPADSPEADETAPAEDDDDPTAPAAEDDPTRPAPNRPATTGPATRRPTTKAPRSPEATRRTTPPPPVTTGPPAPGHTRPTTRPPVTTGPPEPPRTTAPPPATTAPPPGLQIGPDECSEGNGLAPHDGFQNGGRCVDTQMGEVGDAGNNPSLLITDAPERVDVNQPFTIRVSTRNLIRDRFLPAGQGGYYVEMSLLSAQGLVHGHFHTACRVLASTDVAPEPAPPPAFFVATEDSRGGSEPDIIEIRVPGLPQAGTFQCSAWAGDSSHRVPMMQRANQIPALDSVRVEVR